MKYNFKRTYLSSSKISYTLFCNSMYIQSIYFIKYDDENY